MTWRTGITLFLIVALPAIGVAACVVRDDRLDDYFQAVTDGMSSQDVERIMGKPSWNGDCRHGPLPEVNKPANCARELGYAATLAWTGFMPMWWIVWIGPEGTVIRTAKIVSP